MAGSWSASPPWSGSKVESGRLASQKAQAKRAPRVGRVFFLGGGVEPGGFNPEFFLSRGG